MKLKAGSQLNFYNGAYNTLLSWQNTCIYQLVFFSQIPVFCFPVTLTRSVTLQCDVCKPLTAVLKDVCTKLIKY